MVDRLFYDDLLKHYERYGLEFMNEDTGETGRDVCDTLRKSRVFLINGAIAEDLSRIPHDSTNYDATMHIPFPNIFFEFIDPLEIETTEKRRIRGVLYGKSSDVSFLPIRTLEDHFTMNLFHDEIPKTNGRPEMVSFRTSNMPNLMFMTGEGFWYGYDKSKETIQPVAKFREDDYQRVRPHNPETMREGFQQLLDLSVNLVDYINAHNVMIRKVDRSNSKLGAINRKRERKGKKLLVPLEPYYWIDVRQNVRYDPEEIDQEDRTMDYKEWVRGHFRRYHTREGIVKNWIQPYVRGPEDAPWKENRYRVLEDMLKKGPRPTNE